jgi:hypothetical protein
LVHTDGSEPAQGLLVYVVVDERARGASAQKRHGVREAGVDEPEAVPLGSRPRSKKLRRSYVRVENMHTSGEKSLADRVRTVPGRE